MIRRIVLENFMSHRRTVIEPAEGLTVLVGPNNCGKSAIVVALQCMNTCDNRSAPFIRHGQKEARVVVETDEGARVEWIRGKNFTNYKINGREMTRARRPEDLDEHLKLAEVQSEDGRKTFDLHFAEQKNPIFLLNESGAAAATFFAASSDAAYLVQMQSLLKRKESEARTRKRDLESRIAIEKRQLEVFEALPAIDGQVKQAQETHRQLTDHAEKTRELATLIFSLSDAVMDAEAYRADLAVLSPLQSPPEISDTRDLTTICGALAATEYRTEREGARMMALDPLFAPPDLTDTGPLAEAISVISTKDRRFHRLAEKLAISQGASEPPALEDATALKSLVSSLQARDQDAKQARDQVDAVERELEAARDAVRSYVQSHPSCPVCGSLVDADRLLRA